MTDGRAGQDPRWTVISRREFVAAAAAILSSSVPHAQTATLSAQQIADRIRANAGVPWRDKTVDGFRAGKPATLITGVATTAMATIDVLRRAAAAGRNFIVTVEPTFYSTTDDAGTRAEDPIYLAKRALIEQRTLVVWRFSDHWNARTPGEPARALAAALGWAGMQVSGTDSIYAIPETTVQGLASHLKKQLGLRGGLRTVGRPDMRVRTVALSPATTDVPGTLAALSRADVIIAGEPREWEAVPYVLDTRSSGREKALIAVGRIVSEEPGMRACAAWIRSFVTEVPVEPITGIDPYWSPLA